MAAAALAGVVAQAADGASAPSTSATGSRPETIACLVEGDPARRPRYRTEDAALHRMYTVRLEMTFRSGHAKPDIEVIYSNADDKLLDDVRRYVSEYRLPCLADGAPPVVAHQDFSFVEEPRPIVWTPVRLVEDEPDLSGCLRDTTTPGERNARYPTLALTQRRGGAVLVDMTFTDAGQAPTLRNLYVGGGQAFADAADALASHYRLPCLPLGRSSQMQQMFHFEAPGATRFAFKDLTLSSFLGMVEHLDRYRQRFDFTTMGCPFDLRMQWYQPYATNRVGQIGAADSNRREFIDWLRSLALALPDDKKQQLLGQPFTLSVPCGTLDLTS